MYPAAVSWGEEDPNVGKTISPPKLVDLGKFWKAQGGVNLGIKGDTKHIGKGVSYRVIPWQMGVVARLLRLLPNVLFDRLLTGRPRKHRQGE